MEDHGLRIALLGAEEALESGTSGLLALSEQQGVGVLRVVDPPAALHADLERAGFLVTPSWVTWLAPVGTEDDAFLAAMTSGERSNVRRALRETAKRSLQITVHAPMTMAVFDDFLGLYEAQVATMRNGSSYAASWRDEIAADPDLYYVVAARDPHGELFGVCLCWDQPELSITRIAFTAQAAAERQGRVVRALYMTATAEARGRGREWISLGSDPTLYGHITEPGLFGFKARLGFRPVPTRFLQPADPDQADAVVSLRGLTDPTLLLSYAETGHLDRAAAPDPAVASRLPVAEPPLRLTVLSTLADADLASHRAGFLTSINARTISG
ncbi:GNAT family N-acetyltransferase [Kitasatospora sp. MAP5-34]|uniref:GNAT family N-acetyltransferase n=1 Tax=Kitasatospora sp. MAP5-34 TaxID=3035102 RepID=UPI002472F0B8|nr:GNAT family N-acetyltransferase [Kitasatospora sp. MAP5-34]